LKLGGNTTFFIAMCVFLAQEPIELETHWRAFTQRKSFSTNVWTDAYLAAFAIAGNYELVSFDKGIVQYSGVKLSILS
jgi:uncharacterized protein